MSSGRARHKLVTPTATICRYGSKSTGTSPQKPLSGRQTLLEGMGEPDNPIWAVELAARTLHNGNTGVMAEQAAADLRKLDEGAAAEVVEAIFSEERRLRANSEEAEGVAEDYTDKFI